MNVHADRSRREGAYVLISKAAPRRCATRTSSTPLWWNWSPSTMRRSYSTVQNWWPGDEDGKGGIYNSQTKRGDCRVPDPRSSWTQVETGSAVTWKYPSCVLRGDDSVGEFYSTLSPMAASRPTPAPR
ncbi:MAG: SufD family Fe-S cluster assembly protein [Hyphomonas sp.]